MRLFGDRNWLGNARRALVLSCVALLASAASASAADLYTQPGGVTSGACSAVAPCDLEYAVETAAAPGDAVLVTGLTYEVTSPIVVPSSVTIRGGNTLPRPLLRGAAGLGGPTLTVQSGGAAINLRVQSQSAQPALDLTGTGLRLDVTASAANAAVLRGSADLTTAVVHTSGASKSAVLLTDGLLTGAMINHATIVASGAGSKAVDAAGLVLGLGGLGSPTISDSIIGGGATDVNAGGLLASINIDHSTYRSAASSGVVSGGGNFNSGLQLVDVAGGNFQQLATSLSVNTGANADGSSTDLAGNPRVGDGAPDMGAYELPAPPDVATGGTSGVTGTSATLAGTVNPRSAATNYTFKYGLADPPATSTASTAAGSGSTSVAASAPITGLKPGTAYYYRVIATNVWGTSEGSVASFSTPSVAPTATTQAQTSLTSTSAVLNSTVNPGGAATDVKFEWGADTSYGNSTAVQNVTGADDVTPSATLATLVPGQTYHYRVVATNSNGTVNGADRSFTTPTVAPAVSNLSVSGIGTTGATLNGKINPGGAVTTWSFGWSTDSSYSNSISGTNLSGATTQDVSDTIAGLLPGKTYNWRIVAQNSNGTTTATGQFTTNVAAPTATTLTPTGASVRVDGATLRADLTTGGGASRVRFEYGPTAAYGSTTAWTNIAASDSTVAHSSAVSGLDPSTTYHYRAVVENVAGTATGADQTFTTDDVPPPPPTPPATGGGGGIADTGDDTGDEPAEDTAGETSEEPELDGPTQADGLPAPALVPPVGRSTNATPASGTIRVRVPGSDEFVELTEGAGIPVGSLVDATEGSVVITSAKDARGTTQSANFTGAQFKVTQRRAAKPITDITLVGGSFDTCTPRMVAKVGNEVTAAARRKWSRRRLWGNGHGRFRTRGRHGTATVRGTWWLTEDRCDGTYVHVRRGLVEVRDLERRKTVMVPAGNSYLAKSLTAKKRRNKGLDR